MQTNQTQAPAGTGMPAELAALLARRQAARERFRKAKEELGNAENELHAVAEAITYYLEYGAALESDSGDDEGVQV